MRYTLVAIQFFNLTSVVKRDDLSLIITNFRLDEEESTQSDPCLDPASANLIEPDADLLRAQLLECA